jgi:hypothetical protein
VLRSALCDLALQFVSLSASASSDVSILDTMFDVTSDSADDVREPLPRALTGDEETTAQSALRAVLRLDDAPPLPLLLRDAPLDACTHGALWLTAALLATLCARTDDARRVLQLASVGLAEAVVVWTARVALAPPATALDELLRGVDVLGASVRYVRV